MVPGGLPSCNPASVSVPYATNSPEGIQMMRVTVNTSTSLAYTNLQESAAYMGKPSERGKLHEIFDTVMTLNLENGAADTQLDSNQQIDNSVINTLLSSGQ